MDALVSLRPVEIDVEAGEWVWTIPALPAADWLAAVLANEAGSIFPGLLDPDLRADVWAQVAAGRITMDDLVECARHALEAAAGRSWWSADRLVRVAMDDTVRARVVGEMAGSGLDLERISLGLFCDAIWGRMLAGVTEDMDRLRLEAELNTPPAGINPEELEEEDDEEEFLRHVGDRGTGG